LTSSSGSAAIVERFRAFLSALYRTGHAHTEQRMLIESSMIRDLAR
jgi:hypothetical protein